MPEIAKNAFFLISTVSNLSSFVELWTVKFTWPTVLPDLAKKVPKCQKSVTRIGKKLPKWQKSWLLLNYEQCSWPDQTVLPDLAKSCQSSKKVLQEMAKCGQGSQSYTLYTICFTLYALHFTLYTLRFRLKCILGWSVFWSQSVQVSNGDKLRWPKSVRPNCHSGKNIKQPSGSIST